MTPDYADLTLRLAIDLAALGLLSALIIARRPRRGLIMVYGTFNVGLFAVLTVIAAKHVGPAVGFGLFAMLSIVRLRSEPFSNPELSYFFAALVLALVNGLRIDAIGLQLMLDAAVLACLFFVDHPALYRRTGRQTVTLDAVFADPAQLRFELERRLGLPLVEVVVQETDFVRDLTRVSVRYLMPSGQPEPSAALDAGR